jgi:sodium pump decarboxylase gamma subunit
MDPILYGLIVTLLGMLIVFTVLVFLWFVLSKMRVIFGGENKTKVQKAELNKDAPAVVPVQAASIEAEGLDSDELIAVITAALNACMGADSSLVVRRITRLGDGTPAWGQTGRQEQMLNRL